MEQRAKADLHRCGHTVFAPQIEERRVSRGRRVEVLRPLFPNYIFLLLGSALTSVLGAQGVQRLVSMDGVPSRLPDSFVERILAGLDVDGVMRLSRDKSFAEMFLPGQKVRVTDHFGKELYAAIFDGMTGKERCRVLFRMFDRECWDNRVDVSRLIAA